VIKLKKFIVKLIKIKIMKKIRMIKWIFCLIIVLNSAMAWYIILPALGLDKLYGYAIVIFATAFAIIVVLLLINTIAKAAYEEAKDPNIRSRIWDLEGFD